MIRNSNLSKREAAGPRGFSQTIVMHNLTDTTAFTFYFPIHFNHFTYISRGITLLRKIISFTILFTTPPNALYMLTPLSSHYYTPTCFSPQGANLMDVSKGWSILTNNKNKCTKMTTNHNFRTLITTTNSFLDSWSLKMNTRSTESSLVRNYLPSDTVSCHIKQQLYQHPCTNLKFRAYKCDDARKFEVMSNTFAAQYQHSHNKLFPE